ncbi:hypothetical protein KJQ67_07295 [Campylobacter lari]|uniref:hypothetical protein n=1 Tax=Campylobacter TaxID=194 RepID=UPI000B3FC017|nr:MULTISPECIES: hypothetical protein [Campylobacter]EAJ5678849.1 hypothetical protein [Campylobacter lari]EAK0445315.1 hypothetical protein [Campylobacter lari]EAK9943906.1 hypothetical protein [Campylobacter lari]MBT0821026.1 hypothetical protein [Campylobacter lari]MCV3431934.1 hypothetical protein [Campylobacter lari]
MYDYSKYENATPKQLVYALSLAEKRAEKLNLQLKENEELFKFLQKKLKNSFSTKKVKKRERKIPELDEAIEDYKNGNVETYKNFKEYKKAMDVL